MANSAENYEGLKYRLLGTFMPYEYDHVDMLNNCPNLVDDKPSVLMDRILALLGNHERTSVPALQTPLA